MLNQSGAFHLLKAQQRRWERGLNYEPTDTLKLLDYAALSIYGEHNLDTINDIRSTEIPLTKLKTLSTDALDLSVDAIIYYDLDIHMCQHIANTYRNKSLSSKLSHEIMLRQINVLYNIVSRLVQTGSRTRFRQYSSQKGFMHALMWLYFTFDALYTEVLGKTIYIIHTIITQLPTQYRLDEIIDPNLLRDVLLGLSPKYSTMRMINICGIIGHLTTDAMSYDLTDSAITYCLTGTRHPPHDSSFKNRMLTDVYLAIFFGTQYTSFYARYLGAAAAAILCETNKDIFNTAIVQSYLVKETSVAWLRSSPPSVSLLKDVLYIRGFKSLEDTQDNGSEQSDTQQRQLKTRFAGINLIKHCMELYRNQYTSVFFNSYLKMLLSGEYSNMHKQHLLLAGIIKYLFYALSEYFSSHIAKIMNNTVNGTREYNLIMLVREHVRLRPWIVRKNPLMNVPPSAAATAMYEYQETSVSQNTVTSHSIFLKLLFRFFLIHSSSEPIFQFSISYLLSPTELALMCFPIPINYDTWGCGEHPLTSKGLLSTLIDLLVYLPLADTRRHWISLTIACIVRSALPHEKVYFRKYKLFKYVMQVLQLREDWLDLSILDFDKELACALDLIGALTFRNYTLLRRSFDTNHTNSQLLLNSLTYNAGISASCLHSLIYTVSEISEEYLKVFKYTKACLLEFDPSITPSSPLGANIRSNAESMMLNTIAGNWTNIIAFLLSLKIESIKPQTIPIITVALTMLSTGSSPGNSIMPRILRAALFTPILYLKSQKEALKENFVISKKIVNAFSDRGLKCSRQKLVEFFEDFCKQYIDNVFPNYSVESLKALYDEYRSCTPPIFIPPCMSKCGMFEMLFPWQNIMDYLAELSLRSYSCSANTKGIEWNRYGHALMEAQTLNDILNSYPCPDIITVYRMTRAWLMTSLIKFDKSRYYVYGTSINLPKLRVFCHEVLEEMKKIIQEAYGSSMLKEVLATESAMQPVLSSYEYND